MLNDISIRIGAARLTDLPATPKLHKSSSSGQLNQVKNPPPSSQGTTALGTPKTNNSNPLPAMRQAKITATPLYKKCTLSANKGNAEQLASMRCDAKLANFAYTRDTHQLPKGYATAEGLAIRVARNLGINMNHVENKSGAVVDSKSGLTASIVINAETKEIVVIYGGTTSGKKVGEDLMKRSRPGMNFMTTLSQWGANFRAGLGIEPKSYKQAVDLLKNVQEHVKMSASYEGYSVRVIGHSKGGGEAMYASMNQKDPVQTTAFCPAHLSKGLIDKIPSKNLAKATNLINSYSPYGDPVSAMRGKLPDMPGIGNGYHFNGIKGSNPIDLHDQFLTHVEHFCNDLSSDSYV